MIRTPSFIAGALMAAALASVAPAAWADRPFLQTDRVLAEPDDENVWSVESWVTSAKGELGLVANVEYAINPYNSVSFGAGLTRIKQDDVKTYEREFELGYTHILVDVAKQGFGLGISVSGEWAREDGSLQHQGTALALPWSWRTEMGDTQVHVTPGVFKPKEGKGYFTWGTAVEHDLDRRNTVFAELAGDRAEARSTLVHGGWRHWIKPTKVAVDLTAGRSRTDGESRNFVTVGFALFDLR